MQNTRASAQNTRASIQFAKASTTVKEARSNARQDYLAKRKLLDAKYTKDRIKGAYPKDYAYWMQKVEKFYTELATDPELQSKLARMMISEEEINACLAMIREVESLWTIYQKASGSACMARESCSMNGEILHERGDASGLSGQPGQRARPVR